jgi:hypothetical protein
MLSLTINGSTETLPREQQAEAMKRYWAAKQAGDATACLTLVEAEPAPAPKVPKPPFVPGGQVSEIARTRIAQHEKMLAEIGIAMPPPVYAPGARVMDVGDRNFRVSRQKWEEQPEVLDQLRQLWVMVRREKRTDFTVKVGDVKLLDDGTVDFGQGPLFAEGTAMKQMLSLTGAFPHGTAYLAQVEPELRRHNWLKRAEHMDSDKEIKLRVRRSPLTGSHTIFAAVGPTYGVMDVDEICRIIGPAFDGTGMRGTVVYDSATTNLRINASHHAKHVIDLAAGDVFQVGVQVRANDSGQGGLWVHAEAWRNMCIATDR